MVVPSGLLLEDGHGYLRGLQTQSPDVCRLACMVFYAFLICLSTLSNREHLQEKPHFWLIFEICNIARFLKDTTG